MVFATYKELKENRKTGDKVYGIRHDSFKSVPIERWEEIQPIEGTLQSSYYDHPKNGPYPPRHLMPVFPQESHSWDDPWWDVDNWIICDARQEAEAELEKQMKAVIAKAKEQIVRMECLLPSMTKEKTNRKGEFDVLPSYRRDMSLTFDEVISRCITENDADNYNGDLYSMEKFQADVKAGGLTDYDGFGDLVIDGKVYENVYISCDMERVIIGDWFEIPFERLGQVFAGHKLEVLWYNK